MQAACAVQLQGITPACAGIRNSPQLAHQIQKDHPRVRGDKRMLASMIACEKGSPPRARG